MALPIATLRENIRCVLISQVSDALNGVPSEVIAGIHALRGRMSAFSEAVIPDCRLRPIKSAGFAYKGKFIPTNTVVYSEIKRVTEASSTGARPRLAAATSGAALGCFRATFTA